MPATVQKTHVGCDSTSLYAVGYVDELDNQADGGVNETATDSPGGVPTSNLIESAELEGPDLAEDQAKDLTRLSHASEAADGTQLDGTGQAESSHTGSGGEDPSDLVAAITPVEPDGDLGQDDPQGGKSGSRPTIGGHRVHELALAFPAMSKEDFEGLKESIATSGLLEPITLYQGKILDGRHRYRACRELGITPTFMIWDGPGLPAEFVLAKNINRRHLNQSQRAMIAAKLSPGGKGRRSKNARIQAISQDDAAKQLNVGRSSVQQARTIIDAGIPALVHAVDAKEIAVSAAAKIAKEGKAAQLRLLEDARAKKGKSSRPRAPKGAGTKDAKSPRLAKHAEATSSEGEYDVPETTSKYPEQPTQFAATLDDQRILEDAPTEPNQPAELAVAIEAPVRDIAPGPPLASIITRFAEACQLIDENVFHVIQELILGPDDSSLVLFEARVSRAKAALFKFTDAITKARDQDWPADETSR